MSAVPPVLLAPSILSADFAALGDGIAANLFLLGYAFQKGAVPVSLEALLRPAGIG